MWRRYVLIDVFAHRWTRLMTYHGRHVYKHVKFVFTNMWDTYIQTRGIHVYKHGICVYKHVGDIYKQVHTGVLTYLKTGVFDLIYFWIKTTKYSNPKDCKSTKLISSMVLNRQVAVFTYFWMTYLQTCGGYITNGALGSVLCAAVIKSSAAVGQFAVLQFCSPPKLTGNFWVPGSTFQWTKRFP